MKRAICHPMALCVTWLLIVGCQPSLETVDQENEKTSTAAPEPQTPADDPQIVAMLETHGANLVLNATGNIQSVTLQSDPSDVDLANLHQLAFLKTLTLFGRGITDRGLVSIGKIASLQTLRMEKTEHTDEGLAHLKTLPHLQTISPGRNSNAETNRSVKN